MWQFIIGIASAIIGIGIVQSFCYSIFSILDDGYGRIHMPRRQLFYQYLLYGSWYDRCMQGSLYALVLSLSPYAFWYPLTLYALLGCMHTVSDRAHQSVLDFVSLGLFSVGLGSALLGTGLISLHESFFGAFLGWILFACVRAGHAFLRGTVGLGTGDVILITALGTFVGSMGILITIIVSCASLCIDYFINTSPEPQLPFAPHLIVGGYVGMLAYLLQIIP